MSHERGSLRIRDIREAPFCWQEKSVLRLIEKEFKPSERATAIALYVVVTQLASDKQENFITIKRKALGEKIGRSITVVHRYIVRLKALGIIGESPIVKDNAYQSIAIQLLSMPSTPPVVSSTQLPPVGVVSPTKLPASAHGTTSFHPRNIEEEESSSKKNLSKEQLVLHPKTGARHSGETPDESSSKVEGDGSAPAGDGKPVGQPGASDLHSKPIPRGGGVPGVHVPGDHPHPDAPEKRVSKAKFKGLWHPDRPLDQWGPRDAIGYFRHRFMEKFPGEGAPDFNVLKDIPALKHRYNWLREDGLLPGMMKTVIDHIFDKWDHGLKDRIRWEGSRPGYALIESTRWFETLVREVQGGTGGSRKTADSYDPAKHAAFREDVKKTGDPWGGLGKRKA